MPPKRRDVPADIEQAKALMRTKCLSVLSSLDNGMLWAAHYTLKDFAEDLETFAVRHHEEMAKKNLAASE